MTRAALHLDHAGEIRGVTGDMIMERANLDFADSVIAWAPVTPIVVGAAKQKT